MKKVYIISYWTVAIIMIAIVLTSLGYRFTEALFIGTTFLPGAFATRYFYPKAVAADKGTAIKNIVCLTCGIIIAQIFIVLLAHILINRMREDVRYLYDFPDLPEILKNPVFISIMTVILALGHYFMEQWAGRKCPEETGRITFLSERKTVSLDREDIIYIESNDSITTVYATRDRRFRNKTPISHWEANLGPGFIRIHRSYLVNRSAVTGADHDTVYIGDTELPVSRKYRTAMKSPMFPLER